MAEVVSTGVSLMCDNSTVIVKLKSLVQNAQFNWLLRPIVD